MYSTTLPQSFRALYQEIVLSSSVNLAQVKTQPSVNQQHENHCFLK